jgi:hypothetical protein
VELIPIKEIAKALQEQGFEIEIDENHEGRRWLLVFQADRLISVFDADSKLLRPRLNALDKCRKAGFLWTD